MERARVRVAQLEAAVQFLDVEVGRHFGGHGEHDQPGRHSNSGEQVRLLVHG